MTISRTISETGGDGRWRLVMFEFQCVLRLRVCMYPRARAKSRPAGYCYLRSRRRRNMISHNRPHDPLSDADFALDAVWLGTYCCSDLEILSAGLMAAIHGQGSLRR